MEEECEKKFQIMTRWNPLHKKDKKSESIPYMNSLKHDSVKTLVCFLSLIQLHLKIHSVDKLIFFFQEKQDSAMQYYSEIENMHSGLWSTFKAGGKNTKSLSFTLIWLVKS